MASPNDEEKPEVQEQKEEAHEELQPQQEEQTPQEVKIEAEELIMQADEQHGQQVPEAPAAEEEQHHEIPVHLGQPEI